MYMTIQSSVKDKILATSSETSKVENAPAENAAYEYEIRYHLGKANVVTDALSRKERVKPRRVRAMAMIIQYGVRGMILAAQSETFKQDTQSEAFKQENGMMRTVVMDEAHASSKEWNSGDDQLRLRWMIYLVVLADAAESVRDTIGFEYCLASSSGWTKSPVLWAEIGESSLTGPELVLDMTDKVVLIKEKLKAARDRQKSYADNRRKPLEFEVGDRVMLKVSPWKGVIRFGKKGKLAPRYVGPFEILERVGPVAYRLRLPEELSGIKVDKTLRFVEEPVENSDREVKRLKCSRMVVVKVHLGSKRDIVLVVCELFVESYGKATAKMVPEEEDRVEKFIRGLLDNIQGNVIVAEPTRLQDVVRIANNLMDQNLKGIDMHDHLTRFEVIVNGDAPVVASASAEGPIPPKTAKQKLARKNELKAKSTLLLAIPDEHLLKFHGIKDAKTLWEEIKARFGGNKESKKMQKTILKQQYENFTASRSEGLDKTYDRFQKLISQLEIHGEVISQEDADLKLLRSLLSAWNNISLIMHNKANLDDLSMEDLYNNLKVTNEAVNIAHEVTTASSQGQASSSTYDDDVMFSFFGNQSNSLQLDNEDLELIDTNDLEEIDLKWQVAMLTMRAEEGPTDFALMPICLQFNQQREVLNKANLEIKAYQLGLESLEARIVVHQKNEAVYEEDIAFLKYDVKVRDNSITELKNQLAEALREKDDLKLKLEKFETSYVKLLKLINSQISVNNKFGVGFDSQMNENELHDCHLNKNEVFKSASDSSVNETEEENNQVNDRYKKVEEYHAVPPSYTGNYMPLRPDLSFAVLDDSVYKTNVSETITSVPRNESTASKSSKDSLEQPKDVRHSTPIIEEWESDSDDDCVIRSSIKQNKPIATKSGLVPVNVAKQSSPRAATSISTARHVNTGASKPRVNAASPTKYPYFKAHSPLRRPFNQKSAAKTNNFNTAKLNNVTTIGPEVVVSTAEGKRENVVKSSACWIWRPTGKVIDHISKDSGSYMPKRFDYGNPQYALQDKEIFDSGCSRHMTRNKSYLIDYQDIDGGFVAFAGSPKGGKITGKGKIRTGKLDFEDVYFVKELKFNLFSISQMCDKKNSILFTKTECLILSADFKLLNESQVLLKVPRHDNMYSFNLKNVVPSGGLTCLISKATIDESNLWHRRLGHINFKTMNKLVRGNLVRGLPSKLFENDHSCVACQKGKQHKASYSLLSTTFWAEAVNTACYVHNRVLLTKPHNKTPYELLLSRLPSISFMRPFGCPVTILNTLDPLGKFDGKADEGFLVGYSINSKAFRVFNTRTRKVEENLHINFLENKPNVAGSGIETNVNAGQAGQEKASDHEYILLPLMLSNSPFSSSTQSTDDKDADEVPDKRDDDVSQRNGQEKEGGASNKENDQHFGAELDNLLVQEKEGYANSTNRDSTASPFVSTVRPSINTASENINTGVQILIPLMIQSYSYNQNSQNHPKDQIIGDINSATQTRRMTKISEEHTMEPKKLIQALDDPSWIEAMQEELLQFKLQKVWTLVDLPIGKRAIRTKWVFRNKKDGRGIVVRNKARLVAQGYTQEEGIDYDEVFALVARIEAIMLFFAYASFMGFIVYQMDVKSAFLYGTIEEEVYVCQPPGFEDPQFPNKVYKVEKALYGLHQAPRACQDKYDILKKFDFVTVKTASTPIEPNKALVKDEEADNVDVHLYRSMIGSLRYLTASSPDITFVVCACARFQVTPKVLHLHVVKRIFRYLKGQPKLGLWYPRDSPFDLEAFSDSDYAGASLDRKSTTG
ncbi:putative ribonuclease H-like domain-containing protein, partial [Tanacetum coccineum]